MGEQRHDFVVFSDDWGRHPSSCQHLVTELARHHRVLWVNTIGMRMPMPDRFTVSRVVDKFRQWTGPLRRITDDFFVYSPPMLPAAGGFTGRVNSRLVAQRLGRVLRRCGMDRPILLSSVPTAADYLGRLGERAVVYYITDDYRHWPDANAEAIAAQDEQLTGGADLLLPVSLALADRRERKTSAHVEMLPHAVDLDHFARVDEPLPEPRDLADIGRPRLCFFGLVYEKVDLCMLARLAEENPDKHLVLLGPVKADTSSLAALPNVHLLGPRPYQRLPNYLKYMDVLLLPYVLDEQIRRSAPLKIRECLAVGRPIVAVDVPDLRRYDKLIHLAGDVDSYLAACRAACQNGHVSAAQMRAAVGKDSWSARAQQVERALDRVLVARVATSREGPAQVEACTDGGAWDAYVARSPAGSVWHRWGWCGAMRSAYGLGCHYISAHRGGRMVGVLPLAMQTSRIFGRHLVSLPWLDHAGILADDSAAREALLVAATGLARRRRADLRLRELAPCNGARVTRTDKAAMTLELPSTADDLWERFKPKVRNQIRKGQKGRLQVEWDDGERLGEFYAVYSTNMRDLGSPPQSVMFFQEVFRRLGDVARLLLVRQGQTVVAGALVLGDPRAWQVPWASSLRRFNHLCPSHMMYWTLLAAACGRTERFCFGRSSRNSGTYTFKAQWGARAVPLYWHTFLGGSQNDGREDGRIVGLMQRVWRRIPASLARAAGPHIIKCIG